MENSADLLIKNASIWNENCRPCLPQEAALVINEGRIRKIGPQQELENTCHFRSIWDAQGKLLLPGLINTHNHLFQTFMRGMGKDMPFMEWMDHSVRLMMPHMDAEAVYLGAMAGCLEAIRSGTTTLLDYMYANVRPQLCDQVIRAFSDCGIRGILAHGFTNVDKLPGSDERPFSYAPVADSLQDVDRLRSLYRSNPRVHFMLAPSVIWALTLDGLSEIARYALDQDMVVTMHLLETTDDDRYSLENYGKRSMRVLQDSGILDANFLAVHAIHMEEEDFELFRRYGVSVSYNPVANMILGSGTAPIPSLLQDGIKVGLGTDGAASNDSQNLIEVMKSGALLQKVHHRDTSLLSAQQVFSMATDMGAAAIHMQDEIGSLSPGKRADILVVDMQKPNTTPCFDPIASLVYSGNDCNIDSMFVEGSLIYEHGRFCHVDEQDILRQTQKKAQELYYRVNS